MRTIGGLCATALIAMVGLVGTANGQSEDKVTLTVAYTQSIDSVNPLVGFTVAAYEAWNLQYATLTDKAPEDFHTIPGLAESWEGSADGKQWTYTLRPDLKWSDGAPLTAEDVAYTINRSRDEEWINHSATTANLDAKATGPDTLEVTSKVVDPKLPTLDVYIVPKHVYEKYDENELLKYDGQDGVGSGPFTLTEFKKGQFARFAANPNYWRGRPAIDEVVIRFFNNADAMVAALQSGEVDAIHDVPGAAFKRLADAEDIETVEGNQGSFNELALNGGDGLKKGHPALDDPEVRKAIAHAIDRETVVDRILDGLGDPAYTISPSANPDWMPEVPEEQQFPFDLAKANEILDAAGYEDTDGDGVREMPGGGEPLNLRYAVRSETPRAAPTAELVSGWLSEIGIATTQKVYDDGQLGELVGKGDYDMFEWGWTPFVDPDPMLSYFTCDQVSADPENPLDYYNDASLCDPGYDELYAEQNTERDPERRREIVHEMLLRFQANAVYNVMYTYPDLQAYRTDRFEGWTRQPAETGPVIFSNSSPSYAALKPVSATTSTGAAGGGGGDDGGGSSAILIGGLVAVVGAAGVLWVVMRRRTADERE